MFELRHPVSDVGIIRRSYLALGNLGYGGMVACEPRAEHLRNSRRLISEHLRRECINAGMLTNKD